MRLIPFRPSIALISIFGLFALRDEALADITAKDSPPRPPTVLPVTVEVTRGGEVIISLRTVGVPPRGTRFLIRTAPKKGEVRLVSERVPRVIYRHSGVGETDEFSYAAQAPGSGVSAAATVRVLIFDPPPKLSAPSILDFGVFTAGESVSRELLIRNSGGGRLVGQISAPPEFRLPENAALDLGPSEVKIFELKLIWPKTGHYSATLGIETQLGRHPVSVVGYPVAPFEVTPAEVNMSYSDGKRTAELRLKSNLSVAGFFEVQGGGDWGLSNLIELGPGAERILQLSARKTNLGAQSGEITIRRAGFSQILRVKAEPVPALLALEPKSRLDLGAIVEGVSHNFLFTLSNSGGEGSFVRITSPSDIYIPQAREPFYLEPGQTAEIIGTIKPTRIGPITREVTVVMGGQNRTLALRADVRPPDTTPSSSSHSPPLFLPPTTPPIIRSITQSFEQIDTAEAVPLPRVGTPRLIERKGRRAIVEWPHFPEAEAYALERLLISIKDGGLNMEWVPFLKAKISQNGPSVRANLIDLPEFGWVLLRARAFKNGEPFGEPSADLRFLMPRPTFPWLWVILLLCVAGGLFWRATRRNRTQA